MDNREFRRIRKAALAQGWITKDTKHGEVFFSPDGTWSATWHRAHESSDPHSLDSFLKKLERGGFVWRRKGGR